MSEVHVMDHPLIQHKISYIRREDVGTKEFREVISEIASLMCYEATRDLKLQDVTIKTPICEMVGKELTGKKLAVVPILRAGLGMVDGMLSLIPAAKVGHIGLYRDPETLEPVEYYCKLPADCSEREVPSDRCKTLLCSHNRNRQSQCHGNGSSQTSGYDITFNIISVASVG